ncbi:Hypothetical protein NTJ_00790 [Nesidiocoris tenuis]|uniref:Reverse transcriptase domain-containing protein n=1 Tax=Nesidiocoris tenuis TaxID=355587 RepID=A0ABN7A6Z6_9HEMI|nr:Hypothetical protein NTJ_00790 [Nesidiocoris tenuis]
MLLIPRPQSSCPSSQNHVIIPLPLSNFWLASSSIEKLFHLLRARILKNQAGPYGLKTSPYDGKILKDDLFTTIERYINGISSLLAVRCLTCLDLDFSQARNSSPDPHHRTAVKNLFLASSLSPSHSSFSLTFISILRRPRIMWNGSDGPLY